MRHIFSRFILLVSAVLGTLLIGCDQVDYRTARENPTPVDTSGNDTATAQAPVRRALLYDFTGQTCGNCPTGHDQVQTLQNLYGARLVVMSIHCGFFAEPLNRRDSAYRTDYRTPPGNELDELFQASNAGLPKGIINGKVSTKTSPTAWAGIIQTELSYPATTSLQVSINGSNATIKLSQPLVAANAMLLTLYEVRDSISSWQKDYRRPSGTQDIRNYFHRHVLRARPVVVPNFVPVGYSGNKTASYTINFGQTDKPWRNEIIATLSDASTGEIYQVAQAKGNTL